MQKGYLDLITSQVDPVHFIKIDDVYYTLSFKLSNKVSFIIAHDYCLIQFSYDMHPVENHVGPFIVKRKQINVDDYLNKKTVKKMKAQVIENKDEIKEFLRLSKKEDFYYFDDSYIDQIVLIKYKEN